MKALPKIYKGIRIIEDCGMALVKANAKRLTRVAVVECVDCKGTRRVDYNAFKRSVSERCYKCSKTGSNNAHFTDGQGLSQLHRREYNIWGLMKQRCGNPNCKDYMNYGARGISVCDEWLVFENFLEWSSGRLKKDGTLERTNVNKGYNPSNVMILPSHLQAFTRRDSMGIKVAIEFAKAYFEFGKPQGYLKFYVDKFPTLSEGKVRHFINESPHKKELSEMEI